MVDLSKFYSLEGYQMFVKKIAFDSTTKDPKSSIALLGLGLAGEVGEVSVYGDCHYDYESALDVELGDLLWYIAFGCEFVCKKSMRDVLNELNSYTDINVYGKNDIIYVGSYSPENSFFVLSEHCGKVADICKKNLFHGKEIPLSSLKESFTKIVDGIISISNLRLEELIKINVDKLANRHPDLIKEKFN